MSNNNSNVLDLGKILTEKDQRMVLNFISSLSKLNPIEILGCARSMGVRVSNDAPKGTKATPENMDKYLRGTEEILVDAIDAYLLMNRENKRKLLRLIQEARDD